MALPVQETMPFPRVSKTWPKPPVSQSRILGQEKVGPRPTAAVILAHNHPSDHVSPSPGDLRLTEDNQALLAHLDVSVVDRLIVGGNGYSSFVREGILNR